MCEVVRGRNVSAASWGCPQRQRRKSPATEASEHLWGKFPGAGCQFYGGMDSSGGGLWGPYFKLF
jgi:hypothetical protein